MSTTDTTNTTTAPYEIMPSSDFATALTGAVRKIADGERLMGHVLHSALRVCLYRKDLEQINDIAKQCRALALWPILHKAITIVTGGYYTTSDGTRYYRPESSMLRYDPKGQCYEYIDGTSTRLETLQGCYADWHNVPLRGITAKTPEMPLTLDPIRKYVLKLQQSGAKWDDCERKMIKDVLAALDPILTGDKTHIAAESEQTDGINHCAIQTSDITGKPKARK